MHPFRQAANGLIDILFPPVCLLCRIAIDHGSMCETCFKELTPLKPPFCKACGESITPVETLCADCSASTPRPYRCRHSAGAYNGTLRKAIALYKYAPKGALAEPLGRFLLNSLSQRPIPLLINDEGELNCWTVVPVPLHPTRFRERGFNQAARLAQIVADEYQWKLDPTSLRRVRKTRQQAGGLDRNKRFDNVANAFEITKPQAFEGASVLLVDDVSTTMATLNECAHAVRNGGATEVSCLTLARG